MKTKIILLNVLLFFCLLPIAQGSTLGLSLNPVMVEKTASPETVLLDTVMVTNTSSSPVVVYTSVKDFTSKNDSGTASYSISDEENKSYSLASWLTIAPTIRLEAGETKKISFEVKVPKDATPGGHYATLFFQPRAEVKAGDEKGSVVQTNALIGMHMLVTISGDVVKKAEVASFALDTKVGLSDSGMSFQTVIKNAGNVHILPKGRIELYDEHGVKISGIATLSLSDEKGESFSKNTVDFLPLNQKGSRVLPNQVRTLVDEWKFKEGYDVASAYTAKLFWEDPKDGQEKEQGKIQVSYRKNALFTMKLQSDTLFATSLPLSFQSELANTGTVQLHPKLKARVDALLGGTIANMDIPFEGSLDVDQKRPIQFVWDKGTMPLIGAKVTIEAYDAMGKLLTTSDHMVWNSSIVSVLLIVVLVSFLLLFGIIIFRRRVQKVKKTIKARKRS